jgi:hypothetical protein
MQRLMAFCTGKVSSLVRLLAIGVIAFVSFTAKPQAAEAAFGCTFSSCAGAGGCWLNCGGGTKTWVCACDPGYHCTDACT